MKFKKFIPLFCVIVLGVISFFVGLFLGRAVPSSYIESLQTKEVSFGKGYGNVKINIPKDWVYEIEEGEDFDTSPLFSVGFRPKDAEGLVKIIFCKYYKLVDTKQESYLYGSDLIALGDKNGRIFVNPDEGIWAFIQLHGFKGGYVIYAEDAKWLSEYNSTVLDIIADAVLSDGEMKLADVYGIAEKETGIKYESKDGYYDVDLGYWIIRFINNGKMFTVNIDDYGNVLTVTEELL